MTRLLSLLVVCVLGATFWGLLPAAEEVRRDDKGTYLGVLVSPNTDSKTRPVPPTPKAGVRITQVLPNSPAARADLRREDVLLQYDSEPIRDGEHLAELIRNDKPERKVKLRVLRDTREQTAEVTLTLGPPLTLAPGTRKGSGTIGDAPATPPGTGKSGGPNPATVSVVATPLEEGKLRLTVEYYSAGKIQTVTCEGAAEITSLVQKLPERERNLVRVALQRLRTINSPTGPAEKK